MVALHDFQGMTPQEYFEWEEQQAVRHEYFDGDVFAMAGGSLIHADIAVNFISALRSQLPKGCKARNSDAKVGISEKGPFTYPDVSVSCDDRDRNAKQFIQFPRVIIEVLSPSTEAYDRGGKFALYRRLESLQDYVLVSSETMSVEVFRRLDSGNWEYAVYGEGDRVPLQSLGLEIAIEEIYDDVILESSIPQPMRDSHEG